MKEKQQYSQKELIITRHAHIHNMESVWQFINY